MIVAGLSAVVVAPLILEGDLAGRPAWLIPVHVAMVAVAGAAVVRVRLRSAVAGTSWTDAAILICIVSVPAGWVAPVVLAGVFIGKLAGRVRPYKALYNASKDALSATAAVAVALSLGFPDGGSPLTHPVALILVAVTITVVEFAVGVPVLALVAKTPWYRVHRDDADIKAAFFVGKLLVTVLAFALFAGDARLLAFVPLAALVLHLLFAGRLRARSDRMAWQRLAATTDQLDATDIDAVLAAAAGNAVALFNAEQADVLLRDGPSGPLLARSDAQGTVWSGDPALAPVPAGDLLTVTAPLVFDDRPLGEVRLRYAGTVRLTDREWLTLRTFAAAVRTAAGKASTLAAADELARRTARRDPLTGLANRRALEEHGEALLARPQGTAALVAIDVDLVREVNDSLGHVAGDRVLVEVARRLTTTVGPDGLVARLHGDAFAILLADVASAEAAAHRAVAMLACLTAPVRLGDVQIRVDATAGLAVAGSPGGRFAELLREADVARHQAKRGGPRVVRYSAARDPADIDALALGGELPRAIAQREFTVNFQPIVDLATGTMIAAEALARWRHPDRGELDPRRFLAAVERSGLLPSFDEAVLDQALAALVRWRAAGLPAQVAVNACPRSILDPDYPTLVARQLARYGRSGADLVVELTESLTVDDLDLAGPSLSRLRALGVRLALDDFGTRASSLALIARLPEADLKIDRSFVDEMASSPPSLAVVRSTVELARSLGRLVVAEGIEREEQRRTLLAMGCSAGQGHLFGRPLPVDDLMQALERGVDGVAGQLARPMT